MIMLKIYVTAGLEVQIKIRDNEWRKKWAEDRQEVKRVSVHFH